MDNACFFVGADEDFVTRMLDNSNYILNVLVDKSLISVSYDNKLRIHDLLQEMDQEIVRQESVKEPGKCSRLWYHKGAYRVLKKDKVIKICLYYLPPNFPHHIHLFCKFIITTMSSVMVKIYLYGQNNLKRKKPKVLFKPHHFNTISFKEKVNFSYLSNRENSFMIVKIEIGERD